MDTNRKTAIIVGVLYIIGTVAGVLSAVLIESVSKSQDLLINVSRHANYIRLSALFILIMGLALALIPVVLFPILKKFHEIFAVGYVVFRGGLETITYIGSVVSWLLLLPLSRLYTNGNQDASKFQNMYKLLLETNPLFSICTIVFIIGALMFYYVLYKSKLVPRWLSGWGLIAAIPYLVTGLLGIFGVINTSINSPSIIHSVMVFPLAVQEMVLAVWLIVKGFNPAVKKPV